MRQVNKIWQNCQPELEDVDGCGGRGKLKSCQWFYIQYNDK